jgi:hypothetical protein
VQRRLKALLDSDARRGAEEECEQRVTAPALPAALVEALIEGLNRNQGHPTSTSDLERAIKERWPAVLAELEQARPAPAGFEAVAAAVHDVLECRGDDECKILLEATGSHAGDCGERWEYALLNRLRPLWPAEEVR